MEHDTCLYSWLSCLLSELEGEGEVLTCTREVNNTSDHYAISVKKDGAIVGHSPRKISLLCSLFLRRGGSNHSPQSRTRVCVSLSVTFKFSYRKWLNVHLSFDLPTKIFCTTKYSTFMVDELTEKLLITCLVLFSLFHLLLCYTLSGLS